MRGMRFYSHHVPTLAFMACSLLACSGGERRDAPESRDDALADAGSPRENESAQPPAYEAITVDDGGAVAGTVRLSASLPGSATIFNLALPVQGFRIRRRLDDPGLVSLKCDAGHTWMSGFIVVQEHPYYALTTADGAYLIGDVPAGEYRLRTWHEWLGESEVPVGH